MSVVNTRIADALWGSITPHFQFTESSRHLSHYTSVSAAIEILRGGVLWARDTATFDPRHVEGLRYRFAAEAVKLYRKAGPKPNASFRRVLSDQFSDPVLSPSFFAACLSVNADSPHMWREYGDDGNGVALIVDTQLVDPDLKIIAAPCVYEPKAQLDLFAHLLEECDVLANSLPDDEKSQLLPQATALSNMLLQAYKHMYLSPERECRYVYMEHDGQSYPRLFAPRPDLRGLPLARAGSDSPYVRIVTGPRMTDSFAVDLRAQLSAVGYQHIPLETSRVDVATLSRLGGPRT